MNSRHDRGFVRAFVIGGIGYLLFLLVMSVSLQTAPSAEGAGRFLAHFLIASVVTGLIARERRWSWLLIAVVFVGIWLITIAIAFGPKAVQQ